MRERERARVQKESERQRERRRERDVGRGWGGEERYPVYVCACVYDTATMCLGVREKVRVRVCVFMCAKRENICMLESERRCLRTRYVCARE